MKMNRKWNQKWQIPMLLLAAVLVLGGYGSTEEESLSAVDGLEALGEIQWRKKDERYT